LQDGVFGSKLDLALVTSCAGQHVAHHEDVERETGCALSISTLQEWKYKHCCE